MTMATIGRVLVITIIFCLGIFQFVMALFYSFASHPNEPTTPYSLLYVMVSNVWGTGGMVTCLLSVVVFLHELRISRLERIVEEAFQQREVSPQAPNPPH